MYDNVLYRIYRRAGMKAVHDNIDSSFAIEEDMTLYSMVTGGATLRSGFKLILHGTIAGDLTIEPSARAIIHSTVAGRICNEGGRAEVFGFVDAVEDLSPDAVTVIDPAAHVRSGQAAINGRPRT